MPERLITPLRLAQAATDLLLADDLSDDGRHDVLAPKIMGSLGSALAQRGDQHTIRCVQAGAERAVEGAMALRSRLPTDIDPVELACVMQAMTLFRMVSGAAREHAGSAVAASDVSATRLVADASLALAEDVSRESVDRVRHALVVTRQLLESLDLGPASEPTDL